MSGTGQTASAQETTRARRWRRLTVALLVTGYAGYYLCRSDLSVALPLLIGELGKRGISPDAAEVQLGTIASLGVFAYAVGKFPAGSIADGFGGKRNFLAGMGGAIAFTLICAASGALPVFTLAWMGNRLTQALGWAGAVKVTSKWFPFRQYGTVMAIISLSFLFGDAAARQFLAVLMGRGLGWRGLFAASGAGLGVIFLLCVWGLRESPAEIGAAEPDDDAGNLMAGSGAAPASWRSRLGPLLHSRIFWLACGLSLGTTILRETFNLWTPTYFTQATGMSAARAAASSALFPLLGGVSVVLCGWLSDRLGRGGRALIMTGGLTAAALLLFVIAAGVVHGAPRPTVMLVGLIGFFIIGPYSFLAGAIALDFGGRQAGATASGWIDGVGYLGGIISGNTMAQVAVRFGWRGALQLLGAIALVSGIAALGFLPRHGRQRV